MDAEIENINTDQMNIKLQHFINGSKERLRTILKRLGWNVDTQIALNEVSASQEDNSEPNLPTSCAIRNSINTDVAELRKIVSDAAIEVPRKFSDLQLNFTREQKFALYEHVLANSEKCTEQEPTLPALGAGSLTFAEIVAQKKRETKKRRRYRQSKPTHIEEVRGVVDLQMQAMQEYLNAKAVEERRLRPKIYERHKSRFEGHDRSSRRTPCDLVKHHNHDRSRSKSLDGKSSKKGRLRSRTRDEDARVKREKHKKHLRNRSSSNERKTLICHSRSRYKSVEKKYHKRVSRSIERKKHKRRSNSIERKHHKRLSTSAERKNHKRRHKSNERKRHKRRSRSKSRSRNNHRNQVHQVKRQNH